MLEQVRHALTLGYPDLGVCPVRPERLQVIANGPSALSAPLTGVTMALNGSLKLFTSRGLAPTFWAACDPQELVADFLADAPMETIYLVCSKCHPAVFEKLNGRTVILWHQDDEATWELVKDRDATMIVPSITTSTFELAGRLGFRSTDYWGWDGCYVDGLNHAVSQAHVEHVVENQVGDRVFVTTPVWMFEAMIASNRLEVFGWNITMHGDGMIEAVMRAQGVKLGAPAHQERQTA